MKYTLRQVAFVTEVLREYVADGCPLLFVKSLSAQTFVSMPVALNHNRLP